MLEARITLLATILSTKQEKIAEISEMRGKWNRITLHLNAKPKKPNLKVFFNEKLIANFEHELPYDPKYYYWQYGVYRSFVSRHGPPMPKQVVYYDEVRVGSSRAEVENEDEAID